MNRFFYTAVAFICGLILVIAPIAFSIYWAWEYNIENQVERTSSIAQEVLRRNTEGAYQVQSIYQELVNLKTNSACDFENIDLMKRLDLQSEQVQIVGYVEDNIFRCSSHGHHDIYLGPPAYLTPYGSEVRPSFEFSFLPKTKFLLVTNKSTGYTVAIHEKTILGIFNNDHDVSLGLYSLSSKKIIVSRGLIKEEWINRIDKNQQAKFVDDDSFVVMQKSKDLDFVSVAAIPVNSVNQGLYEFAAILVPIGIFSGGLLALAFVKLTRQQLSMTASLKRALKRKEFFMLYQPVIDLETGLIVGAEALVRWRRSTGEMVAPDIFIKVAEESGVIKEITSHVIEMVALETKNLFKTHPDFHIAINLSASDISSKEILGGLQDLLNITGASKNNFLVEVTERGFVQADVVKTILQDIRAMGIDVAIDDFGTGYSSLSYLEKFEIDYLKIDKSFVDTLGKESATSQVVPHIIEMAKSLKLKMIAEGVEEEGQFIYLRDHGVQFAQGWLFSKPINFHELKSKLDNQIA